MGPNPIRILLADDDDDDRIVFAEAIDELKMNIRLNTVTDGVQLMNYLHSSEQQLPYIIFLDLNMPLKNGFECLAEIKNSERLKDITVAVYSSSSHHIHVEETFTKGANLYIAKPCEFDIIKNTLRKVININWHFIVSLSKDDFLFKV